MSMRLVFASGFVAILVSVTPAAAARKKFLTKCMADVAPAAAAAPKSQ